MKSRVQDVPGTPTEDYLEGIELADQTSAAGHQFYCRPETEDFIVFEDVVDRNEYLLQDEFNSDDIIIDVGAHIGSFSYAAALRKPGKVYAYEAHPVNHAIACKNLAHFGDLVRCRNQAVWRSDKLGETLYNEDISTYEGTGGVSVLWNNEGLPVPSISLDEVLFEASNGFKRRIRLLKLDCEGSEYPILFTSNHLDIVDEICGEYHEIQPDRIPERARVKGRSEPFNRWGLRDFLQNHGWSVQLEHRGKADGLFRARPGNLEVEAADCNEPEVNIQELKTRIQEAVARRQAAGQTSFINASAELFDLLLADDLAVGLPVSGFSPNGELSLAPAEITRLALQPEFICRRDDHYHVNDLLKYHDHQFVWNAYRALLKREPDEEGLRTYLKQLRSGGFNKIDVLASLRFSPEGRRNAITIDGLRTPAFIRRLYRLPILGYLMELTVGLARLPSLIRNQRRIEGYLVAQGERVATHFNNTSWALADQLSSLNQNLNQHVNQAHAQLSESFTHSISELATAQKAIARAQHQQVAALFREQQRALPNGSVPGSKIDARDRQLVLDELYASLENQFRGSPEHIKESLGVYLRLLKDAAITSDILDIGCGRGEWLELLRAEGLRARGVESNHPMIDQCPKELEIVEADAIAYLRGLPENSLSAVTAFHFVEHIRLEELIDLLDEINRALRPGGLLIVETPNPKNLVVGACNFYSDPTHRRPLFPETLQFILDHRGFVRTQLQYLHPVEGSPFQDGSEAAQALNSWLFSARDFAIIGWKA